jgi:hypothetical protein
MTSLVSQAQVRVFNSLTNLLATDPNAYMTGNRLDVVVLGRQAPSDSGDQRTFTTTTDPGSLSTNLGHVFQNTVRPTFYHISADRLAERQDARWFGLRNGTNFSASIPLQAAADYCAMTSATDRSRTLVIPKGDYGIDRTVTFKGSIDAMSAVFHVFVPGFPSVGTNMVAFQVGDSSLDVRYADIRLPTVEWHGNTHSDGSTSFEFKEINYSEIRLARTFGSQYGMGITPSVRGFTWNFVRPGQHRDHKVTLALDDEDVTRTVGTMLQKTDRAKFIDWPSAVYSMHPFDRVTVDGQTVGVSTWVGYSANEGRMLTLAVLDEEHAEPGTEVTFVWGEEDGGTRKPALSR